MLGALPLGPIACCQYNPNIKGYTCYDNAGNAVYNQAGSVPPVTTECTKEGAQETYPAPALAPRPPTVLPGRGGAPQVIDTPGGWAPAVPPYITYPVANVAFGEMQTPPYTPGAYVEQGQALPGASRTPSAITQSPSGPLPISDWFGMFRRR